jgi:gluconokinase
MGVSGCGKTTVGKLLSQSLGWSYFDADDFHSSDNISKMERGIALDDADRQPWLQSLQQLIRDHLDKGDSAILACSALKHSYREMLLVDQRVRLVYLKGGYELIEQRLGSRRGHYMPPKLLSSQFEALEEPADVLSVDITSSPEQIVQAIRLGLRI